MRKRLLVELVHDLEEFVYKNKKATISYLTLAHFFVLLKNHDNFLKNLNKFNDKTGEDNLCELEKLAYSDESFKAITEDTLYSYFVREHKCDFWNKNFVLKAAEFLGGISSDYYFKPYFACEILKECVNLNLFESAKKVFKTVTSGYKDTKWEVLVMGLIASAYKTAYENTEFKNDDVLKEFLDEYKEHIIFFAEKYPEDENVKKAFFDLGKIYCEIGDYDGALKLYSRLSYMYSDGVVKLKIFFEISQIYMIKNELEKAIEIFSDMFPVFETNKETVDIKLKGARILEKNGYFKNAFLIYKEIAEKFKNSKYSEKSVKAILHMADILFKRKDYHTALFFADEIIKLKEKSEFTGQAVYLKAVICEFLSGDEFSYDDRLYYMSESAKNYMKIINFYSDNKELISRVPEKYFKNNTKNKFEIDLNYIIFITAIIILSIVLFLKFA